MTEKKASKKNKIFNIVFILAVFIGLLIYIINVEGLGNISHILETANYTWILVGLVFLGLEWGLESIVMHLPLKEIYPKHKYNLSLRANIIGKFFNNITPFSSGGQPLQAYILSKYNLRASDTMSALMMKFVVYQIALFSWALILMAINFQFFNLTFEKYMWLVILGFFLNLIAVVFIILAGINKNVILKITSGFIKLISKMKIGKFYFIKDKEKILAKADESISHYSEQFKKMKSQKATILKMYIISMLQLLAYFSIPFAIYKMFGNVGVSYIEIVTIQTYLLLIISFIPTPGSELGAEGGFALLYSTVFLNGLTLSILFWRIYTFYLPIIIGAFVFLSMNKRHKNIEGIGDNYD